MRINKYIALATGISRRAADRLISDGKVRIDGHAAEIGSEVAAGVTVTVDGQEIEPAAEHTTVVLNKPVGYVCSRNGQGSKTIYELLPARYQSLKPVGRLDKDSSGLLLLTDDGQLSHELTHPRYRKVKIYEIELDKPLTDIDKKAIENGIDLEDGTSALRLEQRSGKCWRVIMHEGRNRQIRRTFAALGYEVEHLHRTSFGNYTLGDLKPGSTKHT